MPALADPDPAGEGLRGLHGVLPVTGDHRGRPDPQQRLPRCAAPSDRHRHGADLVGHVNRSHTDSAVCGGDQHRVARPHPGLLDRRSIGGGIPHPDDDVLGVGAVRVHCGDRGPDHGATDRWSPDICADRVDGTGPLDTETGNGASGSAAARTREAAGSTLFVDLLVTKLAPPRCCSPTTTALTPAQLLPRAARSGVRTTVGRRRRHGRDLRRSGARGADARGREPVYRRRRHLGLRRSTAGRGPDARLASAG